MMSPNLSTKAFCFTAAATAGQTLPEPAAILLQCGLATGNGTAVATFTDQTVVAAAPSAGDVQFTGTGIAPSAALTFSAALVVDDQLVGVFVPPYAFPRAA